MILRLVLLMPMPPLPMWAVWPSFGHSTVYMSPEVWQEFSAWAQKL